MANSSPQVAVMATTKEDIQAAVRELGLSGRAVCIHSSLRSFGRVTGGADSVVDAFLAEGCTVMVPAMCWDYEVAPPRHLRPARNAFDYEAWDQAHPDLEAPEEKLIFSPESQVIAPEMGVIPAAVIRRTERWRGFHQRCSFAALGPHAEVLVKRPDSGRPVRTLSESSIAQEITHCTRTWATTSLLPPSAHRWSLRLRRPGRERGVGDGVVLRQIGL